MCSADRQANLHLEKLTVNLILRAKRIHAIYWYIGEGTELKVVVVVVVVVVVGVFFVFVIKFMTVFVPRRDSACC
jgi:hypothetical protein